jgi:hypothetical protein
MRALSGLGNAVWAAPFPHQPSLHVTDIDWKVELRKIEREYDEKRRDQGVRSKPKRAIAHRPPSPNPALPRKQSRTQIRLQKIQEIAAKQRLSERFSVIGIWGRLILVAALATSLFWWPYGHRCGYPLVTFLLSNAMVIVGGIALCVRTWRDRMAGIFGGSALCVIVAWTVMALHIVPRLGYSPAGGTTAAWSCPASR